MRSVLERFLEKVSIPEPGGCWLWTGFVHNLGYGQFYFNGKQTRAHRASYELAREPIPEGMQIDHLCRVRNCVNPEHLEVVTPRENVLRGEAPTAKHAVKTHCPQGHRYDSTNTMVRPRGRRDCRECHKRRCSIYYNKNKEAGVGTSVRT